MSYSAKAIANAFIDIAYNHGFYFTNLKLQKLVFFAHRLVFNIYGFSVNY